MVRTYNFLVLHGTSVDCFDRCWIGKKRLDQAIEQLKNEFTFHILWKPFLLIPNVPDEGIPLKDYLLKRFGKSAAEKFSSENSPLHQNAAEVVSVCDLVGDHIAKSLDIFKISMMYTPIGM